MFQIDKQYRQVESELADMQDSEERLHKEIEYFKKKFTDANQEKNQAFESLESYQ